MIRFYYYKHPKTGEIFSDQRMEGFEEKPYIKNKVECKLVKDYKPKRKNKTTGIAIINKNREVFEADRDYVKKCNPRNIKFNDGHIERYNPGKHC